MKSKTKRLSKTTSHDIAFNNDHIECQYGERAIRLLNDLPGTTVSRMLVKKTTFSDSTATAFSSALTRAPTRSKTNRVFMLVCVCG